jgi:hypothetical protein
MIRTMKCLLPVVLLFAGWLNAQAPPATPDDSASSRSLADVARDNKQNGAAKSRVLVTNDNLAVTRAAIPDVVFEGQDNADEIIKAIEVYRQSHTAKETEGEIRSWYEKHDALLETAISENREITNRLQYQSYVPEAVERIPTDSKQYRESQLVRQRNALSNRRTLQTNGLRIARLQQDLGKVRTALHRTHIDYEWMKIRCGNGNCSF